MNIFNKTAWKSLQRNRARTLVTIIGVILSAAMIAAVSTFIVSLQHFLLQSTIARDGDWQTAFFQVDADLAQKVSTDDQVKTAALIQNFGYARLENSFTLSRPYLYIAGFSPEAFDTIPIRLLAGRLPQNSGEIVINEHMQANIGTTYALGDVITLDVGHRVWEGITLGQNTPYKGSALEEPEDQKDPEDPGNSAESLQSPTTKTYTVVGLCARLPLSFETYNAPGHTVITSMDDPGTPQTLPPGSYNLYIKLKSPAKVYTFTDGYAADLGSKGRSNTGDTGANYAYNRDYLRYSGVSDDDNFNTVLYSLGAILIALIMIGSVLLIYNAFSISVSERKRQFGLLSSVGATRKQLRQTVLFEGLFLGGIGIPLGLLAGVCGIGVTLVFVTDILNRLSGTAIISLDLHLSLQAITVAALVSVVTIFISAYVPARKAARHSAMDNIRQSADIKIKTKSVRTSRLTERLLGLEGMLAGKNFKRDKKRYRSTIVSLFVSIVLFISASSFGYYLKEGTDRSIQDFGYDLALSTYRSNLSQDDTLRLYDKLSKTTGITGTAYRQEGAWVQAPVPKDIINSRYLDYLENNGSLNHLRNTLPDYDRSPTHDMNIQIVYIDDTTYAQYLVDLGLPQNIHTVSRDNLVAVARIQEYDYRDKRYLSFDIFPDRNTLSLSLRLPSTEDDPPATSKDIDVHVTLVSKTPAQVFSTMGSGVWLIAPFSLKGEFAEFENTDDAESMLLAFQSNDPSASAAEMTSIITEAGIPTANFINTAEMMEASRNILLIINIFVYGFVTLISLIAIANVFNTISTNISLRRREFAMLKSVGMANRGFSKMMTLECVFYGVKALLYGLPTAAAVTFLIYRGVTAGVDVPYTMPWNSVGVSVISVFLVVFVTMMYAIRKVNKENVLDALRGDG
ncbi:MAG: ABC transporter permease [Gracilibacteraceae bacterium]|jgi:putative ABC transport system permease protein|nr:ABC transporter permease [Gracilibacteraceae bacterium]